MKNVVISANFRLVHNVNKSFFSHSPGVILPPVVLETHASQKIPNTCVQANLGGTYIGKVKFNSYDEALN